MWSEVRPPAATQVRLAFGVEVGELRPYPCGFEADAFTDGRWFVKLWRQEPDSDAALALTADLAARGMFVPAAQRAHDGSYTSAHQGRRYALFPFVGRRQATWNDADAISLAMRAVHCTKSQTWFAPARVSTSGASRRCATGATLHRSATVAARLWIALTASKRSSKRARAIDVPYVVCHHDLFPHNVMADRSGRVGALLDWGHALLAPREHDVFVALCGPEPVRFLDAYGPKDST